MFFERIKRHLILLFSVVTVGMFSVNAGVSAVNPKDGVNPDSENMTREQVMVRTGVSLDDAESMSPVFEIYRKLREKIRYDKEFGERLSTETEGMSLKNQFMRDVEETRISERGGCRAISHRVIQELYHEGIECYLVTIYLGRDTGYYSVMYIWNGKKYIIDLAKGFNDCFRARIFTLEMYLEYLKFNYKSLSDWIVIRERLDTFDGDFDMAHLSRLSLMDGTEIPLLFPGDTCEKQ